MKILLSTVTNRGGAIILVEQWIKALHDKVDFYFLSKKGHRDIGVHPDALKHSQYSNEWATANHCRICDNIDNLSKDTIILETNNVALWGNPKTLGKLEKFRRRATHNNVFWLDGNISPSCSRFIGNYLCNFLTSDIQKNLGFFYKFKNITELPIYMDYEGLIDGGFSEDRKIDLLTSYREGSDKISKTLSSNLQDMIASAGMALELNPFKYPNHNDYLAWVKGNVRGYLHFQDRWLETFGVALYEGIKLCDFVIYRPEPYCDKMISRLPASDRAKIIRVSDETELAITLLKKDFLRFPKTCNIARDIYTDRNYFRSQWMSVMENLREGG
jgi:hypothetical protein